MQEIIGIRDSLRADIEGLDGGYATVAKILNKSTTFVHSTLSQSNVPRLSTLEKIKEAYKKAKEIQDKRILALNA